jgi:hypothetical protein
VSVPKGGVVGVVFVMLSRRDRERRGEGEYPFVLDPS